MVKYKELFANLGDGDLSTLHKYAREKSESLRGSLKRAREAESRVRCERCGGVRCGLGVRQLELRTRL